MAVKIPQHLHDVSDELPSLYLTHSTSYPLQVRRTVKLEFSALLADGRKFQVRCQRILTHAHNLYTQQVLVHACAC